MQCRCKQNSHGMQLQNQTNPFGENFFILRPSWGIPEVIWRSLRRSWVPPVASWEPLGRVLGASWGDLDLPFPHRRPWDKPPPQPFIPPKMTSWAGREHVRGPPVALKRPQNHLKRPMATFPLFGEGDSLMVSPSPPAASEEIEGNMALH